jgi:hypothetical protein
MANHLRTGAESFIDRASPSQSQVYFYLADYEQITLETIILPQAKFRLRANISEEWEWKQVEIR